MIVPPGLQQAVALGGLDHRDRDPVLDRPAGVEVLDLGEQLRPHVGSDAPEPHKRRVPDRVEDGFPYHRCSLH